MRQSNTLPHLTLWLTCLSLACLSLTHPEAAYAEPNEGSQAQETEKEVSKEVSKEAQAAQAIKEAAAAQARDEESAEESAEENAEKKGGAQGKITPIIERPRLIKRRVRPTQKSEKGKEIKGQSGKKGKVKARRKRYPTKRPKRELKAPPPLGKIPFPLGERLTFKVNLLNAHAGTVTLKVGQRGSFQERKVVELSGFIQSSPFLENFYPIRDSLVVLADEVSFLPVKSDFFLNEQKRDVKYRSEYTAGSGEIKWSQERRLKGKLFKRRYVHKAPGPIYESLSSLYALRRLELKVGLSFEQYVWDGKRERLVEAKVVGEERILTDLGWFDTYRIEVSTVITGGIVSRRLLKQPPVKGTAWVAKDAHRTPVKLRTPTRLGEAEAVISARAIDTP